VVHSVRRLRVSSFVSSLVPAWRRAAGVALACALLTAAAGRAQAATTIDGGNVGGQVWTAGGSPYYLLGDVSVPAGSTLTIQAGAVVELAGSDKQLTGSSATLVEIVVEGGLLIDGTASQPVLIRGRNATVPGFWWGIEVGAGATSVVIRGASIQHAVVAVASAMTAAPLSISNATFDQDDRTIFVSGGSAVLDALTISRTRSGADFQSAAGTSTITNAVISATDKTASLGLAIEAGAVHVANCTIDGFNTGISLIGGDTDVVNTIITNSAAGLDQTSASGTVAVSHSDLWNNTASLVPATLACADCLAVDPRYVSATDFHLQANSPAVDAGAGPAGVPDHDRDGRGRPAGSGYDLGAYEVTAAASAGGAGGGGGIAGAGGGRGGMAGGAGGGSAQGGSGVAGAAGSAGAGGVDAGGGAAGSGAAGGAAGAGGDSSGGGGSVGTGGVGGQPGTGGSGGVVAGTGGLAMGTGGTPGSGGTAGGMGGHAGAPGATITTLNEGCACAVDATSALPGLALPLFGALAIVIGRRRRRR